MKTYYVYIVASVTGVIYTGMTNNLLRRIGEHRAGAVDGFTKRYGCKRLVYFEETNQVRSAIEREKQIKGWTRAKKLALIRSMNPTWRDLWDDPI